MHITFRKLEKSDFPLLLEWLNERIVKQWVYPKDDVTIEWIEKKYSERLLQNSFVKPYIAQIDGNDVCYIQTFFQIDEPEYEKYFKEYTADENTMGVDLWIGNKEYIHKGYGKYILSSFLKEIVFSNIKAKRCLIDPDPNNKIAIKAYEKVGFKHIKNVKVKNEEFYIMELHKKNFKPL